jgi:multicomponent Na+:H+ antiporter subunit C
MVCELRRPAFDEELRLLCAPWGDSVSVETLSALCACALVGIGLYGLIVQPHPLRKLVAFNIMGSGVFVLFGALAKRGAAAGMAADPVPQALLITAIVVAFAATAVTVALLLRLIESADSASLANEPPAED